MKQILTTLAIGGLLCCASARAEDSKVTLKVTGMTCDKCVAGVQKALKNVDGVKAAEVSLDKKQAVVTVNSAKVKTAQRIAAVDKAGGDRHTFKAEKATVFKCDSCGKTYDKAGSCCGAATKKVQ
jgi:Cu+-exporting ATPase